MSPADCFDEGCNLVRHHSGALKRSDGGTIQPADIGAAAAVHTHDDRYYTESEINTKLGTKVNNSEKGAANGVATLDANGKVVATQASGEIVGITASLTLTADHVGKFLMTNTTSAITITVPYGHGEGGIPIGSEVEIYHHGAGAVYVQSDADTYLIFDGSTSASRKLTIPRYGVIGMKKITGPSWKVSGEAEG